MIRLLLDFTDLDNSASLASIKFSHPLLPSSRFSIRGRSPGAVRNASGTFPWSTAVQGLAIISVLEALSPGKALLAGGKGSPAASLDYAISKGPIWIHDVFGADSKGNSLAKRLFVRTNPERKRPGPVLIRFSSFDVEVRISKGERVLTKQDELSILLDSLLFGHANSDSAKLRHSSYNRDDATGDYQFNVS